MKFIPFNRPSLTGNEIEYITQSINTGHISGDGPFTKKAQKLLERQLHVKKALLTTSCTHALEMAAILLDLMPGDEVIVPSYTFVSTALAFYMHGAKIVFADIRPDTLNIDESRLEQLITDKTRAIVPVHYAGVGCEMDTIMQIANHYKLVVIEDNAHGLYGKYKSKYLGSFGDMATQSFHETKNITCGEGGALIINNDKYLERAEIIREKGTNRSNFLCHQVDKYTWVDKGSSYVLSDILAGFLYGQLEHAEKIQKKRASAWLTYYKSLENWSSKNNILLPKTPHHCNQAYHMFYLLMPNLVTRTRFIKYLETNNINAVFHYIPLHLSSIGKKFRNSEAELPISINISDRLVRLPFFNNISKNEMDEIIQVIKQFES